MTSGGNLASHQEAQRVLDARVVGHVDQPLIDDLRPALDRDVGPEVAAWIAARVDIGRRPGNTRGVGEGRTTAIEDALGVTVAAGRE